MIPAYEETPTSKLVDSMGIEPGQIVRWLEEAFLTTHEDPRWRSRNSIPWDPVASLFCVASLYEAGSSLDGHAVVNLEDLRHSSTSDIANFIERNGPPPPPRLQYRLDSAASSTNKILPLASDQASREGVFGTLSRRRTVRHFARRSLDLESFSTLLRWTFGVHGKVALGEEYYAPLKCSPSGGATHSIEAFPLVRAVEGVKSGVYHYDAFAHEMVPLCEAPKEAMSELLLQVSTGQEFVRSAAAAVLLVARLGRNFWKYPYRARTFGVLHQDAGHLSQTFYLVAAELHLGAFYTAAISGAVTRQVLGIDDSIDAPLGLCGCGIPDPAFANWLEAVPFTPGSAGFPDPEIRNTSLTSQRAEFPKNCRSEGERFKSPASLDHFRNLRISPYIEED